MLTPKEAFDRLSQIFKVTRIVKLGGPRVAVVVDDGELSFFEDRLVEPIEWGDTISYEPPKWRPATEADIGKDARFFSDIHGISHLGKLEVMSTHVRVGGKSILFKPAELDQRFSKCEVCE